VKNRFQSLPFKRNLQRYTEASAVTVDKVADERKAAELATRAESTAAVGLCTLNQVDP
jgi:hypothetical protein